MISTRTRTVIWRFALALVAVTWAPGVATAQHDQSATLADQRRQTAQAHRVPREHLKVSLKKAMARGEVWTSLWSPGLTQCFSGSNWTDSPGLLTKLSGYAQDGTSSGSVLTWQYDRQGNTLSEEITYDGDWDRSDCTYEPRGDLHKGKLVSMTMTSSRFANMAYRATFNDRDQRELETEAFDFERDGIVDAFRHTRYLYDGQGLLVEQVIEYDDDANGTIDFRNAAMATYDAQRRIQQIVRGYYDFPGGPFIPSRIWSVVIDDALHSAVTTETNDYDGDAASDETTRWTTFSDGDGHVLREVFETDWYGRPDGGADGVFEFVQNGRHEYDAGGNVLRSLYEMTDEWGSWSEVHHYTYDTHGRLIRHGWTSDLAPFDTTAFIYSRDQRGRVVELRNVWETIGRTVTYLTQNHYDGFGNLLRTADTWWANDEPPAPSYGSIYEYAAGRSGQTGSDKD